MAVPPFVMQSDLAIRPHWDKEGRKERCYFFRPKIVAADPERGFIFELGNPPQGITWEYGSDLHDYKILNLIANAELNS